VLLEISSCSAQQLYPTVCAASGPGQYLVTALAMLCLLVISPSIYVLLPTAVVSSGFIAYANSTLYSSFGFGDCSGSEATTSVEAVTLRFSNTAYSQIMDSVAVPTDVGARTK
jgi:hypothetical protein